MGVWCRSDLHVAGANAWYLPSLGTQGHCYWELTLQGLHVDASSFGLAQSHYVTHATGERTVCVRYSVGGNSGKLCGFAEMANAATHTYDSIY